VGDIRFFDCNSVIGRRKIKNPGSFHETGELIRKMKYYGIEGAMVYHSLASDYSPSIGNRLLLDEIKDYPFLKGVWVVLPHHTCEFPKPDELRKEMKDNNIKAVRIFPAAADHRYSISDWCCGDLFNMLEACRVPLMISLPQLTWDGLHDVLSAHPRLRLILTELHYNCGRNLYPLLEKFEHLYVETIGFKPFNGIEDVCRRFGAERLIFGTCSPLFSGGAAVGMISYAPVSYEEKCMIASGNLEKLLGGVVL
jgi:hypothetical protein